MSFFMCFGLCLAALNLHKFIITFFSAQRLLLMQTIYFCCNILFQIIWQKMFFHSSSEHSQRENDKNNKYLQNRQNQIVLTVNQQQRQIRISDKLSPAHYLSESKHSKSRKKRQYSSKLFEKAHQTKNGETFLTGTKLNQGSGSINKQPSRYSRKQSNSTHASSVPKSPIPTGQGLKTEGSIVKESQREFQQAKQHSLLSQLILNFGQNETQYQVKLSKINQNLDEVNESDSISISNKRRAELSLVQLLNRCD